MECKMEKQLLVPASMCDHTGRLAIPHIFSLFMDLATEHGDAMGLGMDVLAKKNLIWLTVKTRIRFFRRPGMLENIAALTWPETPGRIRCHRFYQLSDSEGVLVDGKTEWAMMDISTGRLARIADTYPHELEHLDAAVCEGPFSRIADDFSDCPELTAYTVRSTDIDMAQHMNNAAYVHAVFGAFSCRELEEMNIREAEVHFRAPCFEGDRLSFRRRDTEDGVEIGVLRQDGKTAVAVRLIRG